MKSFIEFLHLHRTYIFTGIVTYISLLAVYIYQTLSLIEPASKVSIGQINIGIYTLLVTISVLLGMWGFDKIVRPKLSVSDREYSLLVFGTVLAGLVGARAWYMCTHLEQFKNIIDVVNFNSGGVVIWGAILGGGAVLYARFAKDKDQLWLVLSGGLMLSALSQAVGRWGNYFNSELVGKSGEALFLIESVANLILFLILAYLYANHKTRLVSFTYLIGYGFVRLGLQPLRPDNEVFGLTTTITVLCMLSLGVYGYYSEHKKIATTAK